MSGLDRVNENRGILGAFGLFLRRWFSNPRAIGAVAPSAPGLARRMAREVVLRDDEAVVELGPGTGVVTRALIKAGVPEDRLILVERDEEMHGFLTGQFAAATVIHGDAAALGDILPEQWRGRVSTVISSLPLLGIPQAERARIVEEVFAILAEDGRLVQYTYSPFSPLRHVAPEIHAQKTGFAAFNLPPATIWRYTAP
jgi:phosphatidylethanolamine/phosphatidyl-N-methylethanolamine N-methyltransferase